MGCVFLSFNGGSKYREFLGSVGPCIRLRFALAGVLVDCRFLRPCRAIETIETIEMIETSGGPAWRRCVALGLRRGGRFEDTFYFGCFDSGAGDGIFLWFGRFWGNRNSCFSDSPPFSDFVFFSDFRGGSDLQNPQLTTLAIGLCFTILGIFSTAHFEKTAGD